MDDFHLISTGLIEFDPSRGTRHFQPWWGLLICDDQIARLYAWFLKKYGIEVYAGSRWQTHITFIRGEAPPNPDNWGRAHGRIEFRYTNRIRWDNGRHAWLDVRCPALGDIRQALGLSWKDRYHLTIGRLMREETSPGEEPPDVV